MNLLSILMVQMFWFSFAIIGYAIVKATLRLFPSSGYATIVNNINKMHALVGLLHYFVVGFLAGAIITTPSYIIGLPIIAVSTVYVLLLVVSTIVLVREWRHIKVHWHAKLHLDWLLIVVGCVLLFDYVYALHMAPHLLASDTWVHIAKVNQMSTGFVTLADPFFGYNGVVDVRYSANLIHALMAVGAHTLHISATNMWLYSVGFFRLLMWLSISSLVWVTLPEKVRRSWVYGLLCVLPFISPVFFVISIYPDRVALVWTAIALIGLLLLESIQGRYLFIVGCVLVALTHALNALMFGMFIVFLFGVWLITRQLNKGAYLTLLTGTLICLAPVAVLVHYPNLTVLSEKAVNAAPLSGAKLEFVHIKSMKIAVLPFRELFNTIIILGTCFLYWLLRKADKRSRLNSPLFFGGFLLLTAILLGYSSAAIGFMGLMYLAIVQRDLRRRLVVGCLTVFYALIIYNPLVLPLLLDKLPPWGIARFRELNVFAVFAPVVTVFAAVDYLLTQWKRVSQKMVVAIGVCMLLFVVPFPYRPSFVGAIYKGQENSREILQQQAELEHAAGSIRGTVYTGTNHQLPFLIASVTHVSLVNLNVYAAPPMVNGVLRQQCSDKLANSLEQKDLQAASVETVVLDSTTDNKLVALADDRSYLQPLSKGRYYRIYAVSKQIAAGASTCKIPYRQ